VLIGRDLLDPEIVLPDRAGRAVVAVLGQPGSEQTARLLAGALCDAGLRAPLRVLPDGEAAKTPDVAVSVWSWLAEERLTRDDSLVAVGGGALSDVAGFVAATFLRGIEAVTVTTTLVGAVDASIGGKTALNLGGKNLVGVFRHPARVVVDLSILEALPERLLREGAAEALKTGLVGDPALVELYERQGLAADLAQVVRRAVAVKAGIVIRDPTEQGERAHLNYGHTVGHAVERAAGLGHGAAIAVGMVAAGRASQRLCGFADEGRQRAVLERLGLPTESPPVDGAEVRRLMGLDKKRDAAGLRMVLLEGIGAPRMRHVDSATVDAALAAVGIS
jgi:3-dehydroquinate synthase